MPLLLMHLADHSSVHGPPTHPESNCCVSTLPHACSSRMIEQHAPAGPDPGHDPSHTSNPAVAMLRHQPASGSQRSTPSASAPRMHGACVATLQKTRIANILQGGGREMLSKYALAGSDPGATSASLQPPDRQHPRHHHPGRAQSCCRGSWSYSPVNGLSSLMSGTRMPIQPHHHQNR